MAAQIYAAYITRGAVKTGEESTWMQRSIREAARIAKTVDVSIDSDTAPEAGGTPPNDELLSEPVESTAAATARKATADVGFEDAIGEALAGKDDAAP
jgi:hypothetical protein